MFFISLFKFPNIKLLIISNKLIFFSSKSLYFSIIKNIFYILIFAFAYILIIFNFNTVFQIKLTRFIKLGEIIYTIGKKTNIFFKNLYFKKLDIIFSERDQYAISKLKCSKININHTKVLIILTLIKNLIYLVIALYFFFTHTYHLLYNPFFTLNSVIFFW